MISLLNTRYMQIHETHGQCSTLLLFANKREEDILWREQLEELCRLMPQCKVVHILSSSNESWKGETGTMSSSFLQKYLPEPRVRSENDVKICISGPLAFATSVCDILFRLGYSDDNVHSFD
jgi:cytochrome-b5 reductase